MKKPLRKQRLLWHRKPQTQIAPNKKAEQSRRACREKRRDGGFVMFA